MKKERFIAIRNQADSNTLELYFLDIIADTYDWYFGHSSKVQEIIDKVNYYKPSKIKCIIDSEGGDAQVGMSIYNFLKRCDAKVEVEILGLAGSIASVIAMAANKGKLRIARNAFMMIHKAEGGCYGTAEEMRQGAALVDMYTGQIVDIYSQRTGKTAEEINTLMSDGDYWMTGEDAVAQGFADETFNDTPNLQIAARLDKSKYKHIPASILAQMKPGSDKPEESKTFIQNQFDDMKKYFTNIVNAIRGVKPDEKTPITNQIAEAITKPFDELGDQLDKEIKEKVEAATGDELVTKVTNKVNESIKPVDFAVEGPAKVALDAAITNALAGLDFAKPGPAKTALDTAVTNLVKTAVENAVKPGTDGKTQVDDLVKVAVENATKELQNDLKVIKGGKVETKIENVPKQIGTFTE